MIKKNATDMDFAELHRSSLPVFRVYAIAWMVLLLFMLCTIGAYRVSKNVILKDAESRFLFGTEEIQASISRRLRQQEAALWGGVGLFKATDEVSRDEWRLYFETLQTKTRLPGVQGYGYLELVLPSERESHVARVQAEGFPGYDIVPAGDRKPLSATVFLEPFSDRNLHALGYDMWSEPMRRAAISRARDTGHATVSGMVTFEQETDADGQRGFLMFLPVYKTGMKTSTLEERRAAIRGYVYSPFRIHDLMRGVLGKWQSEIAFRIHDGLIASDDTLIYDSEDDYESLPDRAAYGLSVLSAIVSGGHHWSMEFRSKDGFLSPREVNHLRYIAAGGFIINLLLFLTIYSLATQSRRAQSLARSMTSELRSAKNAAEKSAQTQAALREAAQSTNIKLTAANNGLMKFTSIAAHDLRGPLRRIEAFVEILQKEYLNVLDQEGADIVRRIRRGSTSMRNMLDSLHSYSKLERHHIGDQKSCLLQVIENAIEVAPDSFADADLRLDVPHELSAWGDSSLLEHVFLNLISNAAKFRSKEPLRLEIEAWQAGDGMIAISVTDNGIGIDPSFSETIFEIFARLHGDDEYEGTGIGLAVCRKIISDHGGEISLDTGWTSGARFVVKLRSTESEPQARAA